ncbi:MAG: sigma-70 family RNA polymerase sigma factor [Firmicutes bacterium]|nr:sigma-70 family RNA polymerase sigma factor [Bacillota bacterium]
MLSNEETRQLLDAAKGGCNDAKTRLITVNAPLIKSIIKRYIGKGVDYDDLFQLGALGFVKAIIKYDPSYNVKFTTYAVPLIAGEVKRFLRDDGTIKVSRSVKALYTMVKRYLITMQGAEVQPTIEEIARELGEDPEDIVFALEAAQMPISIYEQNDTRGDGDGLTLAERIPTESVDLTTRVMIKNALASLEPRDRKVIILRYFRNMTQAQVAERLGISQVQVSRIEHRIIAMFRRDFAETGA